MLESLLARLRESGLWADARSLTLPAKLALAAVVITPLTLAFDYRLDLAPIDDVRTYTPYAEGSSLPVAYHQLLGVTQILWLLLGAWFLSRPGLRDGFRTVTVACLAGLLALVLAVTAGRDGIDGFALLALGSTLLPLIAIAGVLLHPEIRAGGLRVVVLGLASGTAVVTLGTIAENFRAGTLSERFDLFLFGPPTDTGLVLAATIMLLALLRPSWLPAGLLAAPLLAGLALTQTRGAVVALALGAVVMALLIPSRGRRALLAAAAGAAALFGLYALVSERSFLLSDEATDLRRAELERHWQLFLSRPAFGYGLAEEAVPFSAAAHNAVLAIANAAGIGGAILWLVAWVQPIAARVRQAISFEVAVAGAVLACVVGGWLTTGTELLLYSPPTNLIPLVLAVAIARAARAEPEPEPEAEPGG